VIQSKWVFVDLQKKLSKIFLGLAFTVEKFRVGE
jgi:hypothetical protein